MTETELLKRKIQSARWTLNKGFGKTHIILPGCECRNIYNIFGEALIHIDKEWETVEMPKEKGDYLVTVYDDSASENIVLHCRWEDLPVDTEKRFWLKGEDITDYVIAWMKFPEAYDKTHNPILSDTEDAWVSQHM